mmetsp:Transcript_64398/g.151290  ORF Transcript_64398/g.151290 Transcript_64398/m.151290 type:complete len:448 (+) Transcript_64398:42-1385(+)
MEAELLCPVCHELVTDPVTLECAHHLCKVHMDSYPAGSCFPCPICDDHEPYVIPEGGPKVDVVLKSIVEALKERASRSSDGGEQMLSTCGHCEEKPATRKCLQCDGVLCEDCEKLTHSKGFLRSHQIVDLKDLEGPLGPFMPKMICPDHGQSFDFYCMDCRALVCSHCSVLGVHQLHQKMDVSKACVTGRETMMAWIDKLSEQVHSAEELLETFRSTEDEITRRCEAQRASINNEMDHLRELIETKRRQLLQKSAIEEKQKRVHLQSQVDRVAGLRSQASGLLQRSKVLMDLKSDHMFLATCLPLMRDMTGCSRQIVDDNTRVTTTFRSLSTDAQARTLGDLELGHRPQPAQQVMGPNEQQVFGQHDMHMPLLMPGVQPPVERPPAERPLLTSAVLPPAYQGQGAATTAALSAQPGQGYLPGHLPGVPMGAQGNTQVQFVYRVQQHH